MNAWKERFKDKSYFEMVAHQKEVFDAGFDFGAKLETLSLKSFPKSPYTFPEETDAWNHAVIAGFRFKGGILEEDKTSFPVLVKDINELF